MNGENEWREMKDERWVMKEVWVNGWWWVMFDEKRFLDEGWLNKWSMTNEQKKHDEWKNDDWWIIEDIC